MSSVTYSSQSTGGCGELMSLSSGGNNEKVAHPCCRPMQKQKDQLLYDGGRLRRNKAMADGQHFMEMQSAIVLGGCIKVSPTDDLRLLLHPGTI